MHEKVGGKEEGGKGEIGERRGRGEKEKGRAMRGSSSSSLQVNILGVTTGGEKGKEGGKKKEGEEKREIDR